MGDGDLALVGASAALVEFVCLAKHAEDSTNAEGYSLSIRSEVGAYCARGANHNHEWVRVPPTPFHEITTGNMDDRPPDSANPPDRMAERGISAQSSRVHPTHP